MAAITSSQSGLWSATTTWTGGVVPGAADTVTIAAGHTVTVDGTYTVGGDVAGGLLINGTLKASRAVSSTLTLRTTPTHGTAGVWDWGTVADPIPASVEAVVVINASATPAHRKYSLTFGTANVFGGFHFHGSSKTVRTTLTAPAAAADVVLQVADAGGWNVGDKLVIDRLTASRTDVTWRQIVGISGNSVTIGAAIGAAAPAGSRLGNLTRNVRVVGSTPQTYQANVLMYAQAAQAAGTVTMSWVEIAANGAGTSSLNTTFAGSGLGVLYSSSSNPAKLLTACVGLSAHGVAAISGSTVTHVPGSAGGLVTFANTQAARLTIASPILSGAATQPLIGFLSGGSALVQDVTAIGGSTFCPCGNSQGPVDLTFSGGVASCVNMLHDQNGISLAFDGVVFGAMSFLATSNITVFGGVKFAGCTFEQAPTAVSTLSAGAATPTLHDGCTYPAGMLPLAFNPTQLAATAAAWSYTIRNGNGSVQQRHTNAGLILADQALKYRGSASLQMQPWYPGAALAHSRTISVQAGQVLTIRGYVRRNAAFGAGAVTLTLSGLGMTPVVVTAPTSADEWHLVTLAGTAPSTGDLTLAVSASSTGGTSAACWIDGIPWADYVPVVRHYGYAFDGQPYVTPDATVSMSEAAVQALTACGTLDDLYDALAWWAVTNPAAALPYSRDGSTLVFGSRNVVVDPAAAQVLSVSGAEIRIRAGALASGTKITGLRTTGVISATGGGTLGFGYVDANGDSFLTFSGIDSWQAYSDANRTVPLGSGAGADRLRFVYAAGTVYYLTVVASGIEYRLSAAPAAQGETVVSLSQAALLTALQAQIAGVAGSITTVQSGVADVKKDTGLIKALVL